MSQQGLDPITRDELIRVAALYPGCAVYGTGIEFLGGSRSECGFVPNEWNGCSIELEKVKRQRGA